MPHYFLQWLDVKKNNEDFIVSQEQVAEFLKANNNLLLELKSSINDGKYPAPDNNGPFTISSYYLFNGEEADTYWEAESLTDNNFYYFRLSNPSGKKVYIKAKDGKLSTNIFNTDSYYNAYEVSKDQIHFTDGTLDWNLKKCQDKSKIETILNGKEETPENIYKFLNSIKKE